MQILPFTRKCIVKNQQAWKHEWKKWKSSPVFFCSRPVADSVTVSHYCTSTLAPGRGGGHSLQSHRGSPVQDAQQHTGFCLVFFFNVWAEWCCQIGASEVTRCAPPKRWQTVLFMSLLIKSKQIHQTLCCLNTALPAGLRYIMSRPKNKNRYPSVSCSICLFDSLCITAVFYYLYIFIIFPNSYSL